MILPLQIEGCCGLQAQEIRGDKNMHFFRTLPPKKSAGISQAPCEDPPSGPSKDREDLMPTVDYDPLHGTLKAYLAMYAEQLLYHQKPHANGYPFQNRNNVFFQHPQSVPATEIVIHLNCTNAASSRHSEVCTSQSLSKDYGKNIENCIFS